MKTSEIKIEKNVPLPTDRKEHGTKYPWSKMKVGDSFVTDSPRSVVHSAANSWAERHKKTAKFTTKKEGDKTRIWRRK